MGVTSDRTRMLSWILLFISQMLIQGVSSL